MKLRIMSDLHLEHAPISVPVSDGERDAVLVLAGDVCCMSKRSTFHGFFQGVSARFRRVLFVPGNHEYWDGSLSEAPFKFRNLLQLDDSDLGVPPSKVDVLNRRRVDIDGVAFIGATWWTSFRNANPLIMNAASYRMNDYAEIRCGGDSGYARRLSAEDVLNCHLQDNEFIFSEIESAKRDGMRVVVITHHAPSSMSIHERYRNDGEMNEFYVNHSEYRIEATKPNLWIHGHVHSRFDYLIGDTRVVCNPRGYSSLEDCTRFDPTFEIEI